MQVGAAEAVGPPQLRVAQPQPSEGVRGEGDVEALAARDGDDLGHLHIAEGGGDGRLVVGGVCVADRDHDGDFRDGRIGELRQHAVDARVADDDMPGGSQPHMVPDARHPVAHRGHPVPSRGSEIGGRVQVHLLGARIDPGLTGRALVTRAAGNGHRRDLHCQGVLALGGKERRDVVRRAGEGIGHPADLLPVEPDVRPVVDAVELEPDMTSGPGPQAARQIEVALVPPGVARQRLGDVQVVQADDGVGQLALVDERGQHRAGNRGRQPAARVHGRPGQLRAVAARPVVHGEGPAGLQRHRAVVGDHQLRRPVVMGAPVSPAGGRRAVALGDAVDLETVQTQRVGVGPLAGGHPHPAGRRRLRQLDLHDPRCPRWCDTRWSRTCDRERSRRRSPPRSSTGSPCRWCRRPSCRWKEA